MPSEPSEGGAIASGSPLSPRAAALRAVALAGIVFAVAALAAGALGVWMVFATLASVALAVAFFRDKRPPAGAARPREHSADAASSDAVILAAIPDPVVVLDRRGLVVDASRSARELFPALRIAQPLSFAIRAPDILDGIDAVLKRGETTKAEFSERGPVERAFEVHIAGISPDADGGSRHGAVLFFRDLTGARRLETMRVDFIANASHELRTPLASVMGFIETLQGSARNDPDARQRFLGIMRDQARRMARLIDDLLSLSRIELSAHVQPGAELDVLALVRHIIDTLGPLAGERGVAISLDAAPDPLIVKGDRDELLRVFENLIENAVKYGQSGGRVEIVAERLPGDDGRVGEAAVSVRDFGPGIAPEHLPRLTERFYRVDVAASRAEGGTGLGLAIVKHIVARHRGRLTIDSEFGKGAMFRVSLPLARERHPSVIRPS